MKFKYFFILGTTLIYLSAFSQTNPIETIKAGTAIGIDYKYSVDNLLNILEMTSSDFDKYSKQLGFTNDVTENWCISSYSQRTSLADGGGTLTKCTGSLDIYWDGSASISRLKDLINELANYYINTNEKDYMVYGLSFNGSKYILYVKREVKTVANLQRAYESLLINKKLN